jgi:hypothetical protein
VGWGVEGLVNGIPVGSVEGFDGFGVQILDCLFVGSADSVFGPCISIKGIDGFGDSHLRSSHGYRKVSS